MRTLTTTLPTSPLVYSERVNSRFDRAYRCFSVRTPKSHYARRDARQQTLGPLRWHVLDRLGRSIRGLIELAVGLSARNVDFRSLTDGLDTSTPSGRLLFHILASVAEMERELVKERKIAGLAAARAKGGTGGGRKAATTPEKIDTARKLLAAGDKPVRIAKLLQVGLSTFYRHCPAGAGLLD